MKTFTKILTAAAATALLATGCVNEDPAYKNNEPGTPPDPNAKGYLTLADMSMRVVVDTDTETRPDDTSDETAKPQTRTDEAQPDVDTFIIEIRDATGKLALQETYGDLKVSIGEAGRLELPVGGYTMEVRSEEAATTPAAEWEHPVYFGSQEFVIEKNQTTPINEVVCTLNNIKVTLMCSKDLADQLTADTKSTVTLGETTMTFLKDETRAAYFMPQGETNTLKLHLEGAFADTPDAPVRINKSISGVKAGQWRKLSIVITYSDKGDIKLDIDVNDFMEDDEIPVNDPDNPGEPGLPVAPTLECPGYDLTKPFQLLASMFDAQGNYTRPFAFNLASSNGIGSFAVKITSDNSRLTGMVSGIGGPEFDLCTIGASDPAYTVLAGLGFPLGDDLKGATSKSFDIAGAMKLLYPAYEGTHAFAFEITDAKGLSARASLTLTVDPANEGPSIVGVDFNIDETQTPSADRDTEIDITAQTGIKSLDVTIDCDNLDAKELGTMGIPARFDLCNIEGFEDTNGTMHPRRCPGGDFSPRIPHRGRSQGQTVHSAQDRQDVHRIADRLPRQQQFHTHGDGEQRSQHDQDPEVLRTGELRLTNYEKIHYRRPAVLRRADGRLLERDGRGAPTQATRVRSKCGFRPRGPKPTGNTTPCNALPYASTARAASCCANTPQRRSPHGWSCSRANTAWRSMREKPSPRRSPNVSTKARRPLRWQPDRRP